MQIKYIFISLGTSLAMTLVLELVFALVFKLRKRALLMTVLVNVLTNPLVVVLYLLLCRYYSLPALAVVAVLEASAIAVEALIYRAEGSLCHPFLFSLGANTFSYFCGLLIGSLQYL